MKEYAVVFTRGDENWGAHVPDLPGCIAVADTSEEVEHLIRDAIEFNIEGMIEHGEEVPEPRTRVRPIAIAA